MTVSTSALGRSQDGWPGSLNRPMESIGSCKRPSQYLLPCPCGSDFRSSQQQGWHGVATICLPSARKTASAEHDLVAFVGSKAAARFHHSLLGGGEVNPDRASGRWLRCRRHGCVTSPPASSGRLSRNGHGIASGSHLRRATRIEACPGWSTDRWLKAGRGVGEHGQDVSRKALPLETNWWCGRHSDTPSRRRSVTGSARPSPCRRCNFARVTRRQPRSACHRVPTPLATHPVSQS